MRRLSGRGRRGPGLLATVARTAVIAGTASSVAGRVTARQQSAARQEEELEFLRRNAAVPAPLAAPPPQDDVLDRLTRLGELRAAGVLTEDEFTAQKARILGA
ncbi:hypothetical protein GCM10009836_73310 [Pseudonocardia ailaonensis]|uniref:SHOCT domain-containing protein n=1 Tax=Pseudonocardia ailaonensis TaxID=367279 RepID=A0ABN2NRV9_9PSEU